MAARNSRFTVQATLRARDEASKEIRKAQGSFKRFSSFLKNRFVVTLNDVSRLLRGAFKLITDSANLEGQTQALKIQLAQQGASFDTFIAKLDDVARGTVSTADLIRSSATALLLGIPADKIAELLDVARASAIATGTSISQAFDDIARGVGRASPLILDNLGIVVRLEDVYQKAAAAMGKSSKELTDVERKTALLDSVLAVGAERVKAYGEAHSETQEAISKGAASMDDFKTKVGQIGTVFLAGVAIILSNVAEGGFLVAKGVTLARIAWAEWMGDLKERNRLLDVKRDLDDTLESIQAFQDNLEKLGGATIDKILGKTADETERVAAALDEAKKAAANARPDLENLTGATEETASAADAAADAIAEEAAALRETAAAAASARAEQLALLESTRDSGIQALITASQFDELSAAQGRAAAVRAAQASGVQLEFFGTRVPIFDSQGRRIGSRLVFPGSNFSQAGTNLDGTPRRF